MAELQSQTIPEHILSDHLPKLLDTYPNLKLGNPSSWLVWSGKGGVRQYNLQICHAGMIYADKGWDDLITAVPKSDEIGLSYQRMLINGPFKSMSDMINLQHAGDNRYFIHCTNLDKWPANVLYNYCIATRLPIEEKEILPLWNTLVVEGFNPVLALLLSASKGGDHEADRDYPFNNGHHIWFDTASHWPSIISGNMVRMADESYRQNPRASSPTNLIWGKSQDYVKINTMDDHEVSKFLGFPIVPPVLVPPPIPKATKKKSAVGMYIEHAMNVAAQQQVPAGAVPIGHMAPPAQPGVWGIIQAVHPDPEPVPEWAGNAWPAAQQPPQPIPEGPLHAIDEDQDDFDEWFNENNLPD